MTKKAVLILTFLTFIIFYPLLTNNRGFLFGDNLAQRIPTLTFFKQEVLQGRFPLWNPFILGGIPFFADLSNNTLAPTNLLYLLMPVPIALTMLVIFYVWIATVFTYFFSHQLTGKHLPSLFSAIIFGFSGTLIAAVNDINSLQGIALIPLVFFAAQKFINKTYTKTKIFLIITLSLQFLSSHPQYSYYTWLISFFYLLCFIKLKLKNKLVTLLSVYFTSLSLVAVQLIPFMELSSQVFRPQTKEFASQNQLQLKELPRLIVANFYGSWRKGSSWGPDTQLESGLANTEGYVGVMAIIFSTYAALSVKSQQKRFWLTLAVSALLFSLGDSTPLFLIRNIFPYFSKFRSPIRVLCFYSFAMAIMAGMGLSKLEDKKINE